jgi:cell division protein ZapA (FtsZ GTPase activity inhibitor)
LKNQLHVDLLGSSFTIQSPEEQSYLEELVDYLRRKIEETYRDAPRAEPVKVALITALNIADELFKERGRAAKASDSSQVEKIAKNLITQIDQCLSDDELRMSR